MAFETEIQEDHQMALSQFVTILTRSELKQFHETDSGMIKSPKNTPAHH